MAFDLRRLDVYRKIPKDLTQPTTTGAVISIICMLFIAFLFISEFLGFITPDIASELFVDNPGSSERMAVFLNISLPNLPCEVMGLDIQDDMGRHEVGYVQNTKKTPIHEDKGCNFEATFNVNKVPGNFHVSTHSASRQPDQIDMSHIIHTLKFGNDTELYVKGSFNPLKETDQSSAQGMESHDYILKIVPTLHETLDGVVTQSYQYTSVHRSYISITHTGRVIPAIWFRYDLTPITVKYVQKTPPLYSFLTSICAIIGGTFTVAGILDSLVYTASNVFKKVQIGKLQ